MNLLVNRLWPNSKALIGTLSINGASFCFTLEPPYGRAPYPPVPAGTYPVNIRYSPKFQRLIPHIDNVPGRTAIEIHSGDTETDTEGCLLVGMDHVSDSAIGDSRTAFNILFPKLQSATGQIFVTFVDVTTAQSAVDFDSQIGG